ncbi:diadenosine tetraphosphate hydrolase [bacterium]|nr:diadenosine tetraphosphate hydrolase [bacterium]|tara:strand:+ start:24222 stop:24686 length:465 start_codon:yes stop_codon:yes gene_type:complete
MKKQETIFHKIVKKEAPCHKIWEDKKHLAFLSIFPNTPGFTVVIPKKYSPSYFAKCPNKVLQDLIVAVKKVAKLLDSKLENVGRTGVIFEGFGVDYLHAKLFPMHGTKDMSKWKPIHSKVKKFFTQYPGYISSHDSERANDQELANLAKKIKSC